MDKVFEKTIDLVTSKKGTKYLSTDSKGEKYFVNLVKENKRFIPEIPANAKKLSLSYTGYASTTENKTNRMTLFGVSNLVFKE